MADRPEILIVDDEHNTREALARYLRGRFSVTTAADGEVARISAVGITMGNTREIPHTVRGEITLEKCIPLGVVMDERICSGHYFAQVFAYIKELLTDPHLMEPACDSVE